MAALTDFADYLTRLSAPREILPQRKVATTAIAGRMLDMWLVAPLVGTAPTTAVVPTNATAGSMLQENGATEQLLVLGGSLGLTSGTAILCDRLSHQGGLSGTVTGAVTTNLPTAALTRYTSGVGVHLGISISGQLGATATTITCTYTNDAGTGSRVSPLTVIGGTAFREASRLIPIPLVSGDTGVRSVESSTLTATTATAGAFGYTLYKPLMAFTMDRPGSVVDFNILDGGMSGGLPEIVDNACLFWIIIPSSTVASINGTLNLSAV